VIDFVIPNVEKAKLAQQFFNRVIEILNENAIKFNEKAVAELINNYFPDWRKVLNELQRYSVSGEIDAGILVNLGDKKIKDLMAMMKKKEFTNVRRWVVDNLDNDPVRIFRSIYNSLYDHLDDTSIPHAVVILGEYQYKAAFVADLEINMMACLTEIMGRVKFK
jgi:replication factor C small subunit